MGSKVPPLLNKSHNFGIYLKKGKRGILQLDFPSQVILVIQRGHIKKSLPFQSLQFFDSEEDLHIVMRFQDSEMEFDADTMEEKYTICRLLDLISKTEDSSDSQDMTPTSALPEVASLVFPAAIAQLNVLKDGLLEKKGNTTITTWNKRRIKVCYGEFSYFKPGEELALNVVQLWHDRCRVRKSGQNSLNVTVNKRVYCFRIPNSSKGSPPVETIRDEWYKAFDQAIINKRTTVRYLNATPLAGFEYLKDNESTTDINSVESTYFGIESNEAEPEGPDMRNQITASVSVSFSYNQKESSPPANYELQSATTLPAVPNAAKCTVSPFKKQNASALEGDILPSSNDTSITAIKAKFTSNTVLNTSEVVAKISTSPIEPPKEPYPDYSPFPEKDISIPKWTNNVQPTAKKTVDDKIHQLLRSNSSNVVLEVSSINPETKPETPLSPPIPTVAPVPPPLQVGTGSLTRGVKLRQVHWTSVERNHVPNSLWGEVQKQVPSFDLALLEEMFAISEKDVTSSAKNKPSKVTLLDAKRAQNLGILFSGFKNDSIQQLMEALNSVCELETFETQKLTTLKRYQPTDEDAEMFRMYSKTRDTLEPVDRFMLDLCEIPKLGMRIDLALTLWDFPSRYQALSEEVDEFVSTCDGILSSSSLPTVLRCLLMIGNHLNGSRNPKESVPGFQVTSINQMLDLKGRDPHYSVMTYFVEQLKVSRPDLLNWTDTLTSVPKVAGYSIRAIGAEVDVLKNDLQKLKKYHKTLRSWPGAQSGLHKKFQSDVQNFILEYERRLDGIHDKSEKLQHRFKQVLAWLGEPSTRSSDILFSSLALLIERFQQARTRLAT